MSVYALTSVGADTAESFFAMGRVAVVNRPARRGGPNLSWPWRRYGAQNGWVIVELHVVPDCPNLLGGPGPAARGPGGAGPAPSFTGVTGDYRSPSGLVGGIDVTGADTDDAARAALDLPTAHDIRTA